MRTLCRDLWVSFLMGLVIPVFLLNLCSRLMDRTEKDIVFTKPEIVEAENIRQRTVALPARVRQPDGSVLQMDMDTYLVGVVLAEMPAAFETEALKAQSVVARTYTRKAYTTGGKHGDGSVCTDSTCCQAYRSEKDFLEHGGTSEDLQKVRNAVLSTSGFVLMYADTLIEATYFSCSGGSTEDAQAVWGTDYPYLQAVSSPGEEDALYYCDTVVFSREEFLEKLDLPAENSEQLWFSDISYTDGGGVDSLSVCGKTFRGTEFRKLLGLRSTSISIEISEETVILTTRGFGHRVGMSQYGADAMAAAGSGWREILSHYYSGTEPVCLPAEENASPL